MGLAAEQSGVAGGDVSPARSARRARARARATAVGIIAEGFRPYFVEGGVPAERIDRLRNWTRRVEPSETGRRRGDGSAGRRTSSSACTAGTWVTSRASTTCSTRPRSCAEPASESCSPATETTGRGSSDEARERARNVDFVELQGPGGWEETMQASDVLLVNQRASVADMSLPSKLTSYFAAGRPVVAAASADSETAREIEAAGAGYVVPPEDPDALRDAILALRETRRTRPSFGASGEALRRADAFSRSAPRRVRRVLSTAGRRRPPRRA